MGNTLSQSQQQQWIQYHQLQQIPGTPILLCSSYDSSLFGQKYILPSQNQSQIESYQIRRNPINNVVNVYHFSLKSDLSKCVSIFASLVVITQRIPYRLSMLKGLSKEQGLYILKNAANGYMQIYKNNKICYPNDKMIGILNNGNIKVWISQIWAKNSPDIPSNRQDKMVDELINVVEQYVRKQETTGFGNFFHQEMSKRQRTFIQLDKVLNIFIEQNPVAYNKIVKNKLKIRVKELAELKAGFLVSNASSSQNIQQNENINRFFKSKPFSRIQQLSFPLSTQRCGISSSQVYRASSPLQNFNNLITKRPATQRQNAKERLNLNQTQFVSPNQYNQTQRFQNQYIRQKQSKSLPNEMRIFNQQQIKQRYENLSHSGIKRVNPNIKPFYYKRNSAEIIKFNFSNPDSNNTSITFGNKYSKVQNNNVLKNRNIQNHNNKIAFSNNNNSNSCSKKINSIHLKEHVDFQLNNKIQKKITQKLKIKINGHSYQKNPCSKIRQIRSPIMASYLIEQRQQNSSIKNNNPLSQHHLQQSSAIYPTTPIYKVSNFLPNNQIKRDGEAQTSNKNLAYKNLKFQDMIGNSTDSLTKYQMKENQTQLKGQKLNYQNYQFFEKTQEKKPNKGQKKRVYRKSDSSQKQRQRMDDMNTPTKGGQQLSQSSLCLTPSGSQKQPETQKFTNMFKYYLQSYQSQNEKQNKQNNKDRIQEQDLFSLQKQFIREDDSEDQGPGKCKKFQLAIIEQGSQMDY